MTVSTEVDHNDYTGNGVTTVFPYQFRIFKAADLTVVTVDLSENLKELILGTDYAVTGAGSYQGGNVILTGPLISGWQISIARELPVTQETDLRNQGKFFAEVHENALDKLTMLIQQCFGWLRLALCKPSLIANYYDALNNRIRNLREPSQSQDAATKNYVDSLASSNLNRTLRVPEPINSLPDAETRANKIVAFDSAGNPFVVLPPSGSASDVLIELAKPTGSGLVGYNASLTYPPGTVGYQLGPFAATHGENKFTREDRADRLLFSHDYGSPLTDVGASINKGLDYLFSYATEASAHGGKLNIPRGLHVVNTQILIDRTAGGADQADNITISGEGMGTSELRAGAGLSAGSSIIKTNEPTGKFVQLMTIRDLTTRGGFNGVRVETASRTNIKNVKIEGASNSGLYVSNSWVNDYSQILAASNNLYGVEFTADKQKTSTVVTAGYALANAASGWKWGFMTYCVANGVASDSNGHHGHLIQNSNGFVMNAPGAESNGRAGIYAEASTALGPNKSILIQGAFMHANNTANTGFANLLHLKTTGGVVNKVTIRDSTSNSPAVNGPNDIIVDGVGAIAKVDNCEMPNRWSTVNGGYINWVHNNLLVPAINFGAGSARTICTLFSTQGYQNTYGGLVTVHVGNTVTSTGARRTATYLLMINKTLSGASTVTVVSSAGETTGATASSPSFTWSINGADQLVAAGATASTAGDFWFEISTQGQVVMLAVGA